MRLQECEDYGEQAREARTTKTQMLSCGCIWNIKVNTCNCDMKVGGFDLYQRA